MMLLPALLYFQQPGLIGCTINVDIASSEEQSPPLGIDLTSSDSALPQTVVEDAYNFHFDINCLKQGLVGVLCFEQGSFIQAPLAALPTL